MSNAVETVNKNELEIRYLFVKCKNYIGFNNSFLNKIRVSQDASDRLLSVTSRDLLPSYNEVFLYQGSINAEMLDGLEGSIVDDFSMTMHDSLNYQEIDE